jgi:hypothetical protein
MNCDPGPQDTVRGQWHCPRRHPRLHPLSVNLREDAIIGHVDHWLAMEFAPHRIEQSEPGMS